MHSNIRRWLIFALGWLSYASTYLLRKPFGVVKADLQLDANLTTVQLGWLDSAFLLPYAVFQMILSSAGDVFGGRQTYGFCLILTSLSMVSFTQWSNFWVLGGLLALNGAAQAPCWPCCTKVLHDWFPDAARNTVFSLIGTSAFAGGVLGTLLAVFLQSNLGWRIVFMVPSVFVGLMGMLVLAAFHPPSQTAGSQKGCSNAEVKHFTFREWCHLWMLPSIPGISVAIFCSKLVRYCLYMWLPMYLSTELKYSQVEAGMLSAAFDVGGVVGSTLTGLLIDRYFHRQTILGCSISTLASTLALLVFVWTQDFGPQYNALFLALTGAFNSGTDCILGGSVPADIGEQDGGGAGAAVTGLVNGFGSLGAVVEGPLVAVLSQAYGWTGVLYAMVVISALGSLTSLQAAK